MRCYMAGAQSASQISRHASSLKPPSVVQSKLFLKNDASLEGLFSTYRRAARKNVLLHDILRHESGGAVTVMKLCMMS